MLWLLQQVNHGDMKIKKKQWIVVLADFLPFYKPLNKCKREWGGGVACHPNCVRFSHTGAKLWSQIPSCIIYIANLTLDLCIFKTIFLLVFLLQILSFFLHSFLTFLQLLPWIFSKCLHWHRFLHFLSMSLSSSIQPPINSLYPFVFAFPIPAVLTPLFLHEELVSTVKTTPSKHPPKNPTAHTSLSGCCLSYGAKSGCKDKRGRILVWPVPLVVL